jgi:hypothetical protein
MALLGASCPAGGSVVDRDPLVAAAEQPALGVGRGSRWWLGGGSRCGGSAHDATGTAGGSVVTKTDLDERFCRGFISSQSSVEEVAPAILLLTACRHRIWLDALSPQP